MNTLSHQFEKIDRYLSSLAADLTSLAHECKQLEVKVLRDSSNSFCIHLKYCTPQQVSTPTKITLAPAMERLAKEYMLNQISQSLSINEVARTCRLSRSHFTRAFKKTTGFTPHEWLTKERIEKAKLMLIETRLTSCRIAAECGFSDQAHFSRVFTKHAGMPPKNWRKLLSPTHTVMDNCSDA